MAKTKVLNEEDQKICSNKVNDILDLVKFNNVKIIYDLSKDIEVEFVADNKVKGSSQDWIIIYEAGWKEYESFIAYQSVYGEQLDDTGRRRKVRFRSKWLKQKAKPQTHYQFVYVDKYLNILGVSQFFQMKLEVGKDSIDSELSFSNKACSSPLKKAATSDDKNQSKLRFVTFDEDIIETNGNHSPKKCDTYNYYNEIVYLKQSLEELSLKVLHYQKCNRDLERRIEYLEQCLISEKNKNNELFDKFIWEILKILRHEDISADPGNSCDWNYTNRELCLKAIVRRQEFALNEMHKVICEQRLLERPVTLTFLPKSIQDTVRQVQTEIHTTAEIDDLSSNTSDEV